MSRRTITYAIDLESGTVWSRVGNKVAIPILDYDGLIDKETGDIKRPRYYLATFNVFGVLPGSWLKWTRRMPIATKNLHREFWGFPPLKPKRYRPDVAACPECEEALYLVPATLKPTNTTLTSPWQSRDASFFIIGTCHHCKETIEVGVNIADQPIIVPF